MGMSYYLAKINNLYPFGRTEIFVWSEKVFGSCMGILNEIATWKIEIKKKHQNSITQKEKKKYRQLSYTENKTRRYKTAYMVHILLQCISALKQK